MSWSSTDLVNILLKLTLIVVAVAVLVSSYFVVLVVLALNARTSKYRPPSSTLGRPHTGHYQARSGEETQPDKQPTSQHLDTDLTRRRLPPVECNV